MKLSRKTLKIGTFTLIVTTIVLAVVIALNLFASELPASIKSIDTTKEKIYTIGDTTKALLSKVECEVNIYMVVESGKEDSTVNTVESLIEQYAAENSNIKYEKIDPALKPGFIKTYTSDTLAAGSVIVASEKANRIISGSEWVMYDTQAGRLTSQQYEMYYSYYGSALQATQLFMGETNLTSAIAYVTSDSTAKIYTLTGHGEQTIADTFTAYIDEANVDRAELNLLTGDGKIPADASMIIINSPTVDISENESAELKAFVEGGGTLFLDTYIDSFSKEKTPVLCSLAESLGLVPVEGLVFDSDPSRYQSYPYLIIPSLSESCPEELWNDTALTYCLPYSHGIISAEGAEENFKPILVTSKSSFIKSDITNITTLEKEEADEEGPFNVAAVSDNGDGKFIWFAAPTVFDRSADYGGNSALFKAIIGYACDTDATVSVDAKVISNDMLTLTESDVNIWRVVLVAVIPLAILGGGAALWIARRRKR